MRIVHMVKCFVLGGLAWPSIELDKNPLGLDALNLALRRAKSFKISNNLRFLG